MAENVILVVQSSYTLAQEIANRPWQRPRTSMVKFSPLIREWIERQFILEHPTEVWGVLTTQSFLLSLLMEAHTEIRKHFPYSPIFLDVVTDPEAPGSSELVASIAPTCDPDAAYAAYTQFVEAWWLDRLPAAAQQLSIIIQYR